MTGAEALQKIIDTMDALKITVDELKVSVQLIEMNIKTLNNRAAGLMRDVQPSITNPTNTMNPNISAGVPIQKPASTMQAGLPSRGRQLLETPEEKRQQIGETALDVDSPGVLTYKKVYGKLANNIDEPLENVLIKVYDKNNEVCATTETDPIGYFETMLKPGRYVAEYTKPGFKAINKTFEVGKNSKEVEIK